MQGPQPTDLSEISAEEIVDSLLKILKRLSPQLPTIARPILEDGFEGDRPITLRRVHCWASPVWGPR